MNQSAVTNIVFHWNQFLTDAVNDPHYVIVMLSLLTGIGAFVNYKTAGFPWSPDAKATHAVMTLMPLAFYFLTRGSMVFILLQVLFNTLEGAIMIHRGIQLAKAKLKTRIDKKV